MILEEALTGASDSVGELVSSSSELVSSSAETAGEATGAVSWLSQAWEWMNAPLPIVGVSLIVILAFVWRAFVSSSFGKKKIAELKAAFETTKTTLDNTSATLQKAFEEFKEAVGDSLADKQEEFEKLESVVKTICETSRNKQVQEAGKTLEATEETETEGGAENGGEEGKESQDGDAAQETL